MYIKSDHLKAIQSEAILSGAYYGTYFPSVFSVRNGKRKLYFVWLKLLLMVSLYGICKCLVFFDMAMAQIHNLKLSRKIFVM